MPITRTRLTGKKRILIFRREVLAQLIDKIMNYKKRGYYVPKSNFVKWLADYL
jgi:hypothetical protein